MFVIVQNKIWLIGWKCVAGNCDLFVGKMYQITIDNIMAITAASFFGIHRRIAHANRKCHYGCLCTVVTEGFVGVKLCGAVKMCGSVRFCTVRAIIVLANTEI